MSRAVLSFINVSSGRYRWWDEFPLLLGRRLALAGIDHVCFYRSYDDPSPQPADGRHPTPEGSLADPAWLRRHVRPVAGRYARVILHTHGHYRPIELWREVRHHRRALWFWTEHQISEPRPLDPARKLGRCLGQRLGRFPARVFGVSEAGAARLAQQFRASTVRCIRTGVRVDDPVRWRDDGTGRVPRRALFVGRVIPGKGIWPLLDAMALLAQRQADVHLTIVGPGMTDEVATYVRQYGLADHVTLAGHQSDVGPFYRDADFVVIPTLVREALGMVSLEARRHALPVIYSDRGGLPETQVDGLTGLKLATPTADAIVGAVLALQSDPARYARMRERAADGLEPFSIETMVQRYADEYAAAFQAL